jgi:hypothetical protein
MNSCPFREFKDMFGRPGKGIHSYRIFDTAIVDYVLSLLGAMLITYLTSVPLVITTICILVLGIIFHILFGVDTAAVAFLGFKCS